MNEQKTFSMSVRLRRTTVEEAYVSVPLDGRSMAPTPDKNGRFHVDGDKVMQAALRPGVNLDIQRSLEQEPNIELHSVSFTLSKKHALLNLRANKRGSS